MSALTLIPRTSSAERERDALRVDLEQRAERAMAYAHEADAADDTDKLDRAVWRYFWRLAQVDFLSKRPVDAVCPQCESGEAFTIAPDFWQSGQTFVCLDHADGWTKRDADVQVAIWRGE